MFTAPVSSRAVQGDWLKFEEEMRYSRDNIVVASGSGLLPTGTVMARVTASGKFKPYDTAGGDGTQTAAGILAVDVDARTADQPGAIVSRHAHVAPSALVYKTSVDLAGKVAALTAMKAAGILTVREVKPLPPLTLA